ncbi:hypothetical protein KL925_004993 [Ogataea polymorpha]|nr:hypothetical protein KL925_004993 [Ogataea polymorpha]
MSSKSSAWQVELPVHRLERNLIFLPGITYRVVFDKQKALDLASRWSAKERSERVAAIASRFGLSSKHLVACVPGYPDSDTCTVCVVNGFYEMSETTVVSFKGVTRGYIVQSDEDTATVEIQEETSVPHPDTKDMIRLFDNIDQFLTYYKDEGTLDSEDKEERSRHILLRLTPLATLLNAQLSASDVSAGLKRLRQAYGRKSGDFAHYNDVLVALFPFPIELKISYLRSKGAERIEVFNKCVAFANKVFEEHLDTSYLAEIWSSLDHHSSKAQSNVSRSQFISNHLRNLRRLVEEMGLTRVTGRGSRTAEDNDENKSIQDFVDSLDKYLINEDGKRLIAKDFERLKQMQSSSSDYQVLRAYLEIIMDLPWQRLDSFVESVNVDLARAREQLDADHYGMESAKERILEYLAVLNLHNQKQPRHEPEFVYGTGDEPTTKERPASTLKAPILLLTGPPGVGKTSLARSIATTLGRKFQRISVGGLNDFADLKGHRRTYVGAIPGLIVQALRRSQSMNPVVLLDEVDKIGSNSRKGDPEAALLEILDPEQNTNFHDHYIGFPIDLSQILFVCTSNDLWQLSDPLRDRMEVIELAGYNYMEKVEISKKYLIPRQLERAGLSSDAVAMDDETILKMATHYTSEPGIRNLERLIAAICRGKAVERQMGEATKTVTVHDLAKYIGSPSHLRATAAGETKFQKGYGVVNGLSYNSDGSGSLLRFEMIGLPGSQKMNCTGRLGEVLLESSQIANTLVGYLLHNNLVAGTQEFRDELLKRYENTSVHLHVPEGAISKDGPSAGITMTLCLMSLVLRKKVPETLAMTGEITLTGKVLPIGGVREKLLGAHLAGKVNKVLLPRQNRKDVIEDFIYNLRNRELAKELFAKFLDEEEQLLKEGRTHAGEPEKWVYQTLGLEIVYVDDFSDVLASVWEGEVLLTGGIREARI